MKSTEGECFLGRTAVLLCMLVGIVVVCLVVEMLIVIVLRDLFEGPLCMLLWLLMLMLSVRLMEVLN